MAVGTLASCSSPCELVVPSNVDLSLVATPRDDLNSFLGFGLDCIDASACSIDAGSDPVSVSARFEPALVWSRSFPLFGATQGVALHADAEGIVISASTTGGIQVDGTDYQSAQQTNSWSTLLELGWDAGTRWVLPMPGRGEPVSDTILAITRVAGGVIAGGSCFGGQLTSAVLCGPITAAGPFPLAIMISDGGIDGLSARSVPGGISSVTAVDGGVLLRELVRGSGSRIGLWSGGDLNTSPSASYPGLYPFTDDANNRCVTIGEQVHCAFAAVGAINANGCVSNVTGPTGATDVALVRLTAFDQCAVVNRFNASTSSGNIGARSLNGDGPLVLVGQATSAATFGSTTLSAAPAHWIAQLDQSANVEQFASDPTTVGADRTLVNGSLWGRRGLLVMGSGGVADPFWGRTFTQRSTFVSTFAANDLSRQLRQWVLTDSDLVAPARARISRVNDLVIVVIAGSDVRLGGRLLAPDSQSRLHVLVFRE